MSGNYIEIQVNTKGDHFGRLNEVRYVPELEKSRKIRVMESGRYTRELCRDDAIKQAQEVINEWQRNYETFAGCPFRLVDFTVNRKKPKIVT